MKVSKVLGRVAGGLMALVLVAVLVALGLHMTVFAPDEVVTGRCSAATSPVDFDRDSVDDYADLLRGAKAEASYAPQYDGPPQDRGACTDTVWRSFASAGYSLKAMVDRDIARDPDAYRQVAPTPDPNIDFRRVGVLSVFFGRYATKLTCEVDDRAAWQAGDIVVFGDREHIGIVSNVRDAAGRPFIIHNMGQPWREEDYLAYPWAMKVTGHYRWDASRIDPDVCVPWGPEDARLSGMYGSEAVSAAT